MNKNSTQWQLAVIHKIEMISDWLSPPERKKMSNILQLLFMGILLLWGMFLVPSTILRESESARELVKFTATIFPWIDNAQTNYGIDAEKFVYWQCVSVWLLIFPVLLGSLAYSEIRLNKKIKGKRFYSRFLTAFPAGIVGFAFATLLPNCFYSTSYIPLAQRLFMLNEYFSATGAILLAMVFDAILIAFILLSIYLIHFVRNFNQYINNSKYQ